MNAESQLSLYFTTVLALTGNQAIVGGHLAVEESSPTATMLLRCGTGGWSLVAKVDHVVYGVCADRDSDRLNPRFGVLGREGVFAVGNLDSLGPIETVPSKNLGYLEDVVWVDGEYFCCGAQRQVLARSTHRRWRNADDSLYVPFEKVPSHFLLSMAVSEHGDIWVCGSDGFVARRHAGVWHSVACPTNLELNCVYVHRGFAYVGGAAGTLFRLRPDGTADDLSDVSVCSGTLYDLCDFGGRLFIAAEDRLLVLDGDKLRRFDLPDDDARVYAVSGADSLWCVGDKIVRQYTGADWLLHEPPTNR